MSYKEILKQIKPYRSPITDKAFICIEKDGFIKEKEEIDLDYWLLCLAVMKSEELKNNCYELNYPQFNFKLKVEIEDGNK